ncbi:uncharacterized protein FPRO_00473 [Fusarium proliferatum ET1]|uniref:Uncharacterized protein n=1 Tax=Fusarium proliferatum (strain ET1) TaxID=1227346 RepID=A0A1L7V5J8_FUSPR|nr:uncharacterized protein FPRO_00473 [Fusarium proliferatum ET1]CZR35404.1 uncharacterized protein FPRO_00473 [Fusarium proliferatum ET1]
MLLGLLTMPNSCIVLIVSELRHGFRSRRIIGSLGFEHKELTYLCITDDRPLGSKPATVGTCTIRQKARKAEQEEK